MNNSIYKYRVSYREGKVQEFDVHGIDTVEGFVNQHFGSVNPEEHGVTIELIAIDGQEPPSADVEQKPVVQPQAPAQTNAVADVLTPPPAPVAPAPVAPAPAKATLGKKK